MPKAMACRERPGRAVTRALPIERAECYSYGLPVAPGFFLCATTSRVGP